MKARKKTLLFSLMVSASSLGFIAPIVACAQTTADPDVESLNTTLASIPNAFTLKADNKITTAEFVNLFRDTRETNHLNFLQTVISDPINLPQGTAFAISNIQEENFDVTFKVTLSLNGNSLSKDSAIRGFEELSTSEIDSIVDFFEGLKDVDLQERPNFLSTRGKVYSAMRVKETVRNVQNLNLLLSTRIRAPRGFSIELTEDNVVLDGNNVTFTLYLKRGSDFYNNKGLKVPRAEGAKTFTVSGFIEDDKSVLQRDIYNTYLENLVNKGVSDLSARIKSMTAREAKALLLTNDTSVLQDFAKDGELFKILNPNVDLIIDNVSENNNELSITLKLQTKPSSPLFSNQVFNAGGQLQESFAGKVIKISGFITLERRLLDNYVASLKALNLTLNATANKMQVPSVTTLQELNQLLENPLPLPLPQSGISIETITYSPINIQNQVSAAIFVKSGTTENEKVTVTISGFQK